MLEASCSFVMSQSMVGAFGAPIAGPIFGHVLSSDGDTSDGVLSVTSGCLKLFVMLRHGFNVVHQVAAEALVSRVDVDGIDPFHGPPGAGDHTNHGPCSHHVAVTQANKVLV